ncbi:MAG: argininosuccinate lyase [Euryarchaeota archaeon]|nr:argininosuccinate lyase [Euryarchaeota archaeon]
MTTENKFTPQNLDYILSLDSDRWIFHADMLVDKAHVVMLEERDIISREQSRDILNGLIAIEQRGAAEFIEQELLAHAYDDVHTAIESVLIRELGEGTGGRMHTGRSRNDEVATCIRIALRDDLIELMKGVNELRRAVIEKAAEHVDTVMPGYTHLQHAQPTTLAHHLSAYSDAFARDFTRLVTVYERTNVSPLGAAAFASTGFPLDRASTAKLLGFDSVMPNSMDAVSTRDFVIEAIACFANLMTNLSRLAEEIILWSTAEFDFVRVPEDYITGSSIMPQKRNPDFAELVRSRTGTVYGCLMSALAICKALPYAYNRDLQEVTTHLLKATGTTAASVSVVNHIVAGLEAKKEEMKKKTLVGFTTATELADTIVRTTGISFRTAHKIVSSLAPVLTHKEIHELESGGDILRRIDALAVDISGKKLSELGLTEENVKEAMDVCSNIEKRNVYGGPAKEQVLKTIETRFTRDLNRDEELIEAKEEGVKRSLEELERRIAELR